MNDISKPIYETVPTELSLAIESVLQRTAAEATMHLRAEFDLVRAELTEAHREIERMRIMYNGAYELAMDEREEGKKARAELALMTEDRDSEQRWANQYKQERDAARAEAERLRGIIQSATSVTQDWPGGEIRLCCDSHTDDEHEPDCPFYQWEGGKG